MTFVTLDDIMELQQRYYENANALVSQTRAMTVEAERRPSRKLGSPSQDRDNNNEAEPRPRHLVRDRGKTEAAGCRGRAETETGRKLSRSKAAASRTTSLP